MGLPAFFVNKIIIIIIIIYGKFCPAERLGGVAPARPIIDIRGYGP